MEKQEYLSVNNSLKLGNRLTFEEFQKSKLYTGQADNRFFWITEYCYLDGFTNRFKLGLCFRNHLIARAELYCADDSISNESIRFKVQEKMIHEIKQKYDIKFQSIENSSDVRNHYCSIILAF